ncbi:CPBP family intramembrane glutamic endopeptidase [Alkaliphilus pronyensis]|uniref:CPBP family intramembrane glutamic endopeptidase n=1 Tax=Alkaliphilus pronyensis TaxID=1482732 RepID=UPI001A9BEC2C|nr:CPBP family intramembrane glutamic endopeptidase [Alkaliphilus pronyensis]
MYVDVSNNATAQFAGKGFSALIPALIFSFIKTGLSEEIFFRGFLAKRLISKFGFKIGNIAQGLLFGLLHGMLFFWIAGVLGAIVIITLTGISGWLSGWINEKQSGGSIISSWLLHGTGNIIASIAAMFNSI